MKKSTYGDLPGIGLDVGAFSVYMLEKTPQLHYRVCKFARRGVFVGMYESAH